MSDGSRKTDFDLSITIPNTKSNSNFKFNSNYVKLSEYMNIDERLEESLSDVTQLFVEGSQLNIIIQGEIYDAIDSERFIRSLKKLESDSGCKWNGHFEWYHDYDEIIYESKNGFKGEDIS